MRRLNSKWRTVSGSELVPDAAGPEAGDGFRLSVDDGEAGRNAMRRVIHRWQSWPAVGPAVHVLMVAALQILNLAEPSTAGELAGEEIFPRVEDRLRHHVSKPGSRNEFDDLSALVDRKGHRYGAHHMLARLERRDRHPPVIRDRRVDMHEIDISVGEHVFVTLVASIDSECVSHRVQRDLRSATD